MVLCAGCGGRGNLCDRYVPWSHYRHRSGWSVVAPPLLTTAALSCAKPRLSLPSTPPSPHHHTKVLMLSVSQNAVHELNEKCWDLCVEGKPSNRLDRGQENCLRNCVERFLGATVIMPHQLLLKTNLPCRSEQSAHAFLSVNKFQL